MASELADVDIYDNGRMSFVLRRSPGAPAQVYQSREFALRSAQLAEEHGDAGLAQRLREVSREVRRLNAAR